MSDRVYSGPRLDAGRRSSGWLRLIPWLFAGVTIVSQIVWVLVSAENRVIVTAVSVTGFFLASASHAYVSRGLAWTAGYLAISLSFGWLIEVLGTATQFPFGDYDYTDALGPSLLGVPILIPMAWAMIAYPMLLAVQRLSSTGLGVALIGGWFLMTWDFFLDPQMVGEGYWTWNSIGWELPGIDGIPLQNFLGWWLGGIVLMFALDRLPRKSASRRRSEHIAAVDLRFEHPGCSGLLLVARVLLSGALSEWASSLSRGHGNCGASRSGEETVALAGSRGNRTHGAYGLEPAAVAQSIGRPDRHHRADCRPHPGPRRRTKHRTDHFERAIPTAGSRSVDSRSR